MTSILQIRLTTIVGSFMRLKLRVLALVTVSSTVSRRYEQHAWRSLVGEGGAAR